MKLQSSVLRRASAAAMAAVLAIGLAATPAHAASASGTHNCLTPNQQQGVLTATVQGSWSMRAPGSTVTNSGPGTSGNLTRTERANRLLGGTWSMTAGIRIVSRTPACVMNAV